MYSEEHKEVQLKESVKSILLFVGRKPLQERVLRETKGRAGNIAAWLASCVRV